MTVKSASTNALCLTCHGPGKTVGPNFTTLSEHTHHAATSTGSQCISCHMPKTGENSVGQNGVSTLKPGKSVLPTFW